MSKKKTHDEFLIEISSRNPNVTILGNYISAQTKIKFSCNTCGYVGETMPNTLLNGRGCPICGKSKVGNALRKTHEQYLHEISLINDNIEILTQYTGRHKKISVRCRKCGYEWMPIAGDLLRGHGCSQCGLDIQKNAKRYSQKDFTQKLHAVNPNLECVGKYYNNHKKILIKCNTCGHTWLVAPYSILAGHGCPECARTSTSFFEQAILYSFKLCLGEKSVLSRNRSAIGMELDIFIPTLNVAFEPGSWHWHKDKYKRDSEKRLRCAEKGIRLINIFTDYYDDVPPYEYDCIISKNNIGNSEWDETKQIISKLLSEFSFSLSEEQWNSVRTYAREKSGKMSMEEIVSQLHTLNPNIIVLSEYIDGKGKVSLRCKICDHIWETTPSILLNGSGCPVCGRKAMANAHRANPNEFLEKVKKIHPTIQLLEPYVSSKSKILCKCEICNEEWSPTPNNLLKGQGCPKCGRKRAKMKNTRSHDEFVQLISQKNPRTIILGKYTNSSNKIKSKCSVCGYEWDASPVSLLSGHGCPKCGKVIKRTQESFETELKEQYPSLVVKGTYINANTKIKILCSVCGYEWESRPHDLLRSKGCPKCRKNKQPISKLDHNSIADD